MDHQYNFSITNPIKLYTTVFLYHNRLKKSQPSLNLTVYSMLAPKPNAGERVNKREATVFS